MLMPRSAVVAGSSRKTNSACGQTVKRHRSGGHAGTAAQGSPKPATASQQAACVRCAAAGHHPHHRLPNQTAHLRQAARRVDHKQVQLSAQLHARLPESALL